MELCTLKKTRVILQLAFHRSYRQTLWQELTCIIENIGSCTLHSDLVLNVLLQTRVQNLLVGVL